MKIALVGCAKKKLDHAAPARLLYASSTFKMALAWAQAPERGHDRVCVLSAAYGIVELDQVLLPYDVTMADVPDRRAWGARVVEQLAGVAMGASVVHLVVLVGAAYSIPLRRAAREGWRIEEPLAGMTTGPRRSFLSRGGP